MTGLRRHLLVVAGLLISAAALWFVLHALRPAWRALGKQTPYIGRRGHQAQRIAPSSASDRLSGTASGACAV